MKIKLKQVIDEDFTNFKQPSMLLAFPCCIGFKCDKENGLPVCHNSALATSPDIEVDVGYIVKRYLDNPITSAIVCGGLEPLDSFSDLVTLIEEFRKYTNDVVVVYSGYEELEIQEQIKVLSKYSNIVLKMGRYKPNQDKHFDGLLGVELANDEQYAKLIICKM